MKSRFLLLLTAITLFALLTMPVRLAGQNNRDHHHKHHHYQLVDMGTFGGPVSSNVLFLQGGTLNSRGATVGWSATSTPTSPASSPFICGGLDGVVPFITHAFEWQKGAVADLGSLAGADYCSEPFWVNAKGEIVGASENGQIDPLLGFNQSRLVQAVQVSDRQMTQRCRFHGSRVSLRRRSLVGECLQIDT